MRWRSPQPHARKLRRRSTRQDRFDRKDKWGPPEVLRGHHAGQVMEFDAQVSMVARRWVPIRISYVTSRGLAFRFQGSSTDIKISWHQVWRRVRHPERPEFAAPDRETFVDMPLFSWLTSARHE